MLHASRLTSTSTRRRRVSGEKVSEVRCFAGLLHADSVRCAAHAYCPAPTTADFRGEEI
jgi:hypothetical protein